MPNPKKKSTPRHVTFSQHHIHTQTQTDDHAERALASCERRFCPAQTEVWMILRKSWPERGLKMKMAPLIGLVVRLPVSFFGGVFGWVVGYGRQKWAHLATQKTEQAGALCKPKHKQASTLLRTLERLVDGDAVDVCVVHEPDYLVAVIRVEGV